MSEAPGSLIRKFRERADDMSLDGLADRLAKQGLDRPSKAKLSRIETGQPIPVDMLPALAAVTGIPPKKLRPDLAALFRGPK